MEVSAGGNPRLWDDLPCLASTGPAREVLLVLHDLLDVFPRGSWDPL